MRVYPVNLSNEYETVEFLPLSDMHIGSPFFNDALFKQYIDYIKAAPNRYCVLNGDMMDVVTKCSVGDIYRQKYSPREQIEVTEKALLPIKDRIWGIITGNHEDRIDKEVGLSTPEILAYKLGVAFVDHNHDRKHPLSGYAGAVNFAAEVYSTLGSPVWNAVKGGAIHA